MSHVKPDSVPSNAPDNSQGPDNSQSPDNSQNNELDNTAWADIFDHVLHRDTVWKQAIRDRLETTPPYDLLREFVVMREHGANGPDIQTVLYQYLKRRFPKQLEQAKGADYDFENLVWGAATVSTVGLFL